MKPNYVAKTTIGFEIQMLEIVRYYQTNEGQKRAHKVANSISNMMQRIAESPFEFPVYEKTHRLNIRKAVVHNTFIILFKIIETEIIVFDIYHGKQNII